MKRGVWNSIQIVLRSNPGRIGQIHSTWSSVNSVGWRLDRCFGLPKRKITQKKPKVVKEGKRTPMASALTSDQWFSVALASGDDTPYLV